MLYILGVFIPLFTSFISGYISLQNKYLSPRYKFITWLLTTLGIFISFIIGIVMFNNVIKNDVVENFDAFHFFTSGDFYVNWSFNFDVLTTSMYILVTFISFLVHFYSYGYLGSEKSIARFQSYLSLFTFSMLFLISSNNLIQMFVGWELISFCSFLLISFYYKKTLATYNANKAFIINRIGDIAFILGILTSFMLFKTVNFDNMFIQISSFTETSFDFLGYSFNLLNLICFLFFIAAITKSGQLFFHVWLQDAMEAPTPVSALLHAATMVTAGVFLLVKLAPLYNTSQFILDIILIFSAISIFISALIACTQTDIKKIIAYSTVSQLGYMFLAIALKSYNGAIYHLFSHAFFKALLFLCAGVVIHALNGEQNIKKMGGLYKKLPFTYICFLIGSLALSGIFPFSGYYSKDFILENMYIHFLSHANLITKISYFLSFFSVLLTSFYSFRIIFVVFHGKSNLADDLKNQKLHSSFYFVFVLFILAFFSIVFGKFFYSYIVGSNTVIFWKDSLIINDKEEHVLGFIAKNIVLIISVLGVFVSYIFYISDKSIAKIASRMFSNTYKIMYNRFYIDEIYSIIFITPYKSLSNLLYKYIDVKLIDNLGPNLLAGIIYRLSIFISKIQSGNIYHYLFLMLLGIFSLLTWLLFKV